MSGFTTGGNENPALTDNWDDAEGYYSRYSYVYISIDMIDVSKPCPECHSKVI